MSPSVYVCRLERSKDHSAGALPLADCYIDVTVEYLVVTMHQALLFLQLRMLTWIFFRMSGTSLFYTLFFPQAIVPNNSIDRNQVPLLSIYRSAPARFNPRATLAAI